MGKPKFSVGEFVYVPSYRKHGCFFYIYDYINGQSCPYCIIPFKNRHRIYVAKAKNLKSIPNIIVMVNNILSGSVNIPAVIARGRELNKIRHDPKRGVWGPVGSPLGWELDREVAHARWI